MNALGDTRMEDVKKNKNINKSKNHTCVDFCGQSNQFHHSKFSIMQIKKRRRDCVRL